MSFIVQCFASKQSITEGLPCRIIPLLQGRAYVAAKCSRDGYASQEVYAPSGGPGVDGNWSPQVGFLEAISDDYGHHQLRDTSNNVRVFSELLFQLAKSCAVVELGDNPSSERAFNMPAHLAEHAPIFWEKLKDLTWPADVPLIDWPEATVVWAELQVFLSKHRVFVADWNRVFRPLSFGVMHEFAYHWFLRQGEATPRLGRSLGRTEYVTGLVAKSLERQSTEPSWPGPESENVASVIAAGRMHSDLRDGLRFIGDNCIGTVPSYSMVRASLLDHQETGKSIEDAFLVPFKSMLDDQYVLRGLDLCQITLEPQHYAGQDYANEAGMLYAQFVAETSAHVNALVEAKYEV